MPNNPSPITYNLAWNCTSQHRVTSSLLIGWFMAQSYVLGIDQGGSGSRAIVLDAAGAVVGYGYQPVSRIYPQPGWVEQDPQAIAESVRAAIAAAVEQAGCAAAAIV